MSKYLLRLDDASEYWDSGKWERMASLLQRYKVKPLFGIIPDNRDESLVGKYPKDTKFWEKVDLWMKEGWIPALHGYEHVYVTKDGGINPVNKRSEFAGLSYEEQARKLAKGYQILKEKGITPKVFFAPSHTFDANTLTALKTVTPIRIVSDTIANDVYYQDELWFVPQQSGRVRKLPFKTVTFCYHPNTMSDSSFDELESFLKRIPFSSMNELELHKKGFTPFDRFLRWLYFLAR